MAGFRFPFDGNAASSALCPSNQNRVADIYHRRFSLYMSTKLAIYQHVTPSEPAHEHSYTDADQALITFYCLPSGNSTLSVEHLFSSIYDIFPPSWQEWSIPGTESRVTFFKPPASTTDRFYQRGYLVPFGPALSKLGTNYHGNLAISLSGLGIKTTGNLFENYCRHIGEATDIAIRTIPNLGVELADGILSDPPPGLVHGLSQNLQSYLLNRGYRAQTNKPRQVYRTAFERVWTSEYPPSSDGGPQKLFYLYSTPSINADRDKGMISGLGFHPVPVSPLVKEILERASAYPPVSICAEGLLRSAPDTAERPCGINILEASLKTLFPQFKDNKLLSLCRYEHDHPFVVWDKKIRRFVMRVSLASECEHAGSGGNARWTATTNMSVLGRTGAACRGHELEVEE